MRSINFQQGTDENLFSFEGDERVESFIYKPSVNTLWKNIKKEDFSVELLINPLLDKESNVFELRNDQNNRVGYVFPVSVLDTEMDLSIYPHVENYIYVAFWTLLERLSQIKPDATCLSECFEDNVSVVVFHNQTTHKDQPLSSCIHTLRKYGYSYFEPNNAIQKVEGYRYTIPGGKIKLRFEEPPLYQIEVVDVILRNLPKANDIAHRIVLLYQIIEYLFEQFTSQEISNQINRYHNRLCPENDFIESIRNIGSERQKIHKIFGKCKDISESSESFKESSEHLFELIHYKSDKNDIADIFYSFRNQFVHSYRKMLGFKKELAETVQCFELLVLDIIEKYPVQT